MGRAAGERPRRTDRHRVGIGRKTHKAVPVFGVAELACIDRVSVGAASPKPVFKPEHEGKVGNTPRNCHRAFRLIRRVDQRRDDDKVLSAAFERIVPVERARAFDRHAVIL